MMQSPEFRRMMTDPDALRQMTQMQRMFGGGMGGMGGGGGGGGSFPAPGITDTTPGEQGLANTSATPAAQQGPAAAQQQQALANPFAMFGNPAAGGQQQAGNPFAQLFNPSQFGITPAASPPPPASAGQGTPAAPSTPGGEGQSREQQQQQQQTLNPFANLGSNPFLQNPALMQQMLGAMGGEGGTGAATATGAGAGAGAAAPTNPFAALFGPGGMMGGMGGMGAGPQQQPPQDTRPPEERYAEQLRQLNDMGFYEFERNVEALRRTGGSVQGAVEYLLTH